MLVDISQHAKSGYSSKQIQDLKDANSRMLSRYQLQGQQKEEAKALGEAELITSIGYGGASAEHPRACGSDEESSLAGA